MIGREYLGIKESDSFVCSVIPIGGVDSSQVILFYLYESKIIINLIHTG